MACRGNCLDRPQVEGFVPVVLDVGMLETIDAYCRRCGLAGRCGEINDLLMLGLSGSMGARPPGDA